MDESNWRVERAMGTLRPENDPVAAFFGARDGRCPHCSDDFELDVFDAWGARDFSLSTCCEGLHSEVVELLNDDPRFAAKLLNALAAGELMTGGRSEARRVVEIDGRLQIDWNLVLDPDVPQREVKRMVAEHHRHCPPMAGWRFGAGVRNGADLLAVASVGRPVARGFDPLQVVEVNRLCVREDLDPHLAWNACSMLYGWSAREAQARGFVKIVTYTLVSEPGTSLLAAGFEREAVVRGRSWNGGSRRRTDKTPTVDKVRWVKHLRPHRPHRAHRPDPARGACAAAAIVKTSAASI